jgi:hypothetical protein
MDIFGISKEEWAMWGTFGDAFGGAANTLTLLAVIIGGAWTLREVRRSRETHAHETRVASAREIWRASLGVTKTCGVFLVALQQKMPLSAFRATFQAMQPAHETFSNVVADAALFFTYDVFLTVDAMNHAVSDYFSTLNGCTDETYREFELKPVAEAFEKMKLAHARIFAKLGRVVHVDDFEEWERSMAAQLKDVTTSPAGPPPPATTG